MRLLRVTVDPSIDILACCRRAHRGDMIPLLVPLQIGKLQRSQTRSMSDTRGVLTVNVIRAKNLEVWQPMSLNPAYWRPGLCALHPTTMAGSVQVKGQILSSLHLDAAEQLLSG